MDLAATPARRGDLVEEVLDAETVVYDPGTGNVHRLDAIATLIWRRLDGVAKLEVIARELAAQFEEDDTRVQRDVVALTLHLREVGLLR